MLFNFKKKNNDTSSKNVVKIPVKKVASHEKINSDVKVLGAGCAKCKKLVAITTEVLNEMNLQIEVEHVTDFAEIASYGVLTTPQLVVKNKVVSQGKVLNKEEVANLLKNNL